MATNFSGRVVYANGLPASNVKVHIFDRDDPGKVDDDLTVQEGLSDAKGRFSLTYDPARYPDLMTMNVTPTAAAAGMVERIDYTADPTDKLIPYLQFSYKYNDEDCQHSALIAASQNIFHLPETAPVKFIPSTHGFHFLNLFPGYPLPDDLSKFLGVSEVKKAYGLCGGMSSSAYDFFLSGDLPPMGKDVPPKTQPLWNYLYERQLATFGLVGEYIFRFAEWMALPDNRIYGTQKRTYDEFVKIQRQLDTGFLSVIGLVYVSFRTTVILWNNHQVLAHSYTRLDNNTFDIHIYDPNFPDQDDVFIRAEKVEVGRFPLAVPPTPVYGLKCMEWQNGHEEKPVRGFFTMPYDYKEPPAGL